MKKVIITLEIDGDIKHSETCGNSRQEIEIIISNIKKMISTIYANSKNWKIFLTGKLIA